MSNEDSTKADKAAKILALAMALVEDIPEIPPVAEKLAQDILDNAKLIAAPNRDSAVANLAALITSKLELKDTIFRLRSVILGLEVVKGHIPAGHNDQIGTDACQEIVRSMLGQFQGLKSAEGKLVAAPAEEDAPNEPVGGSATTIKVDPDGTEHTLTTETLDLEGPHTLAIKALVREFYSAGRPRTPDWRDKLHNAAMDGAKDFAASLGMLQEAKIGVCAILAGGRVPHADHVDAEATAKNVTENPSICVAFATGEMAGGFFRATKAVEDAAG